MGETSRPQFFGRVWGFDLKAFFAHVTQLRAALPDEIKAANRIIEERDRILKAAESVRDRLLEEAREQVALLVSNDAIARGAAERAEAIMQRANQEALEVRRGAEEYAMRALANLEEYVLRVMTAVRSARERLSTPPAEETAERSDRG
jgi:hypothetical protein